ncbi:TPA: SAM-dependent methyltransferase, partial [Pseudomonas aeruginosa]
MSDAQQVPAIVILGQGALDTARRVQARYPGALVHGLAGRVEADRSYTDFGDTLRELYCADRPIVALCAAGIVIRSLAPLLQRKGAEPPVLALAEDGSAVVPLLGGLAGVNRLAREIGEVLAVAPAITTSGELRFGTCVLNPPAGYVLADLEQGKRFVADLLGGQPVRVEGAADWLDAARLPRDPEAALALHVTPSARAPRAEELLIHPRCVLAALEPADAAADAVRQALVDAGLAAAALGGLLADSARMADPRLQAAADALGVPLRFLPQADPAARLRQALPAAEQVGDRLAVAAAPLAMDRIGQRRGRLTVIGLGPGCAELMVPAARRALDEAEDILGYQTYVDMAGPFRAGQVLHGSDNREELQRARHAFELAATGRAVVLVSSGDPGVFAMAAAVLEALHGAGEPAWDAVELRIFPGVS